MSGWQDILCNCICEISWDRLLERFSNCADGDCFQESLPQLPNAADRGPQDPNQFMAMGFMVLPMLFVIYGIFQHLCGRRRVAGGSDDTSPSKPSSSRQGPPGPGPSGTA